MAENAFVSNLDAIFKQVYSPDVQRLIPEFAMLQKDIPFKEAKKTGESYRQPVILGMEQGVTYAKGDRGDAFPLLTHIAGARQKATVLGSECVLRSAISYKGAFSGTKVDKRSFKNATDELFISMRESHRRREELDLLYGGHDDGIGKVSSVSTSTITIQTAEWAPGIWAGMVGARIQVFSGGASTHETGGVTADSDYGGYYSIASVDLDNRTITVTETPTGLTSGDTIHFHTARVTATQPSNETLSEGDHRTMSGAYAILANTGTLFGISASTYNLWKGATVAAGSAPLQFDMFLEGAAKTLSKGMVSKVTCYVNPNGWIDLMSDMAALRRYDSSNSVRGINLGAEQITFYTPNGVMQIKAHPCVKEGIAICIPTRLYGRIGATDITWRRPSMGDNVSASGSFFRELSDSAGFELRSYSDQALFTPRPGLGFLITGIVNS